MKCVRPALSLSFSIFFSSVVLLPCYSQVVISETDFEKLIQNLKEVKSLSIELESLRNEREQLLAERQSLLNEMQSSLIERQALIDEKKKLLDEKEKLVKELSASLTIACQSLSEADLQAQKLETENKIFKVSTVASIPLAILFALLYFLK